MIQKCDLYVCAAYHAQHGLDCKAFTIKENAEMWCSVKRLDGWVAMMQGHNLAGERASQITVGGTLSDEDIKFIKSAIENARTEAEKFKKEFANEFAAQELFRVEQGRRISYEAALGEIYRLLQRGGFNNNALLFNIKKICETHLPAEVLEDLGK